MIFIRGVDGSGLGGVSRSEGERESGIQLSEAGAEGSRGEGGERAAMHDGRAKDSFSSPSSFSLEEEAPPRWEKKSFVTSFLASTDSDRFDHSTI